MAIKLANGDYADRPLLTEYEIDQLIGLVRLHYADMTSGLDHDDYDFLKDELLSIRKLKAKLERSQDRITTLKYN